MCEGAWGGRGLFGLYCSFCYRILLRKESFLGGAEKELKNAPSILFAFRFIPFMKLRKIMVSSLGNFVICSYQRVVLRFWRDSAFDKEFLGMETLYHTNPMNGRGFWEGNFSSGGRTD